MQSSASAPHWGSFYFQFTHREIYQMVTRYQHGTAEQLTIAAAAENGSIGMEPAPQAAPSTYVHTGVTRFIAGQEDTTNTGVTQYSAGSTAGPYAPQSAPQSASKISSVLSTLSSTWGAPSVELIPGVPGSRTLVDVAVKEGLLRRGAGGQLEDTAAGAQAGLPEAPPQEAPTEQSPEDAAVFDAEEDATWQQDVDPLPQHSFDGAVSSVIGLLVNGRGTAAQTAKALASSAGIEVADAEALIDAGFGHHAQMVNRALEPMGIKGADLDSYRAFISKTPGKYQHACQQLVHLRDVSVFREMAKEYLRTKKA